MSGDQDRRSLIEFDYDDDVAVVKLNRPEKRNAVSATLVEEIGAYFRSPPEHVRAAVLYGSGDHFSAGLDLSELTSGTIFNTRARFADVARGVPAPRVRPLPGGRGAARRGDRRRSRARDPRATSASPTRRRTTGCRR